MPQLVDRGERDAIGPRVVNVGTDTLVCGSALFKHVLEVSRSILHHLVEEERCVSHRHSKTGGGLAFNSEVRKFHNPRLPGAFDSWVCHTSRPVTPGIRDINAEASTSHQGHKKWR